MIVSVAEAAFAIAISPSRWAIRWNAIGAMIKGWGRGVPSSSIPGSRAPTPTSIRGRIASRRQDSTLSRSVISSPAPPTA